MYSPGGRTGRTPRGLKPIVAAAALALMGMGGVALADPKAADPGPPEQAQGNGPAPQAEESAPPPHAQIPGPAPQANAKAQQRAGKPAEVPPAPPPAGNADPAAGTGHHGRPAPGENRGQGQNRSSRARSGACRQAGCRHGGPKPSAGPSEQPAPAGAPQGPAEGEVPGVSEDRPDDDGTGAAPDERPTVVNPELGPVLGLDQGGGEEIEAASGSFDGALPFTGFEVVLLAGIGALLALAGARLRRFTA